RDPVITSDALLRRGPGPAAWSSTGKVAYYRVAQADGMTLQLMVGTVAGGQETAVEAWSEEPFRATAAQGSVMDRTFAGTPAFSPDGSLVAVAGSEQPGTDSGIYVFS